MTLRLPNSEILVFLVFFDIKNSFPHSIGQERRKISLFDAYEAGCKALTAIQLFRIARSIRRVGRFDYKSTLSFLAQQG
jgi:hypothetical protein